MHSYYIICHMYEVSIQDILLSLSSGWRSWAIDEEAVPTLCIRPNWIYIIVVRRLSFVFYTSIERVFKFSYSIKYRAWQSNPTISAGAGGHGSSGREFGTASRHSEFSGKTLKTQLARLERDVIAVVKKSAGRQKI